MRILFIAAEAAPFVSVGGLSQFMYFLPQALVRNGHDVRIFTAKHGAMDETAPKGGWNLKTVFHNLRVPIDITPEDHSINCTVQSYTDKRTKVTTYFLENREYFNLRANVYWYKDDYLRFALLAKACLEWLYQLKENADFWPDIIHCNDWNTAYLIDFARRHPRYKSVFARCTLVLTVHNFAHQGDYDFRYASKDEYDYGKSFLEPLNSPALQRQNALKRGLLYSDAINTVSQTHAVEVFTPEYACGLDDVLREVRGRLTGILNGLDIRAFDPKTDTVIKRPYNVYSFVRQRIENKKELQKLFGLSQDSNRPVLAFSGRLWQQKGIDLLLEVIPHLLLERPEVQCIVLGTGDERYRLELTVLQKQFPDQVGLHLRSDFRLPRQIFAGADIMLIPSLYEPGGIIALESLRYGCVPVVRRTGGLNDIITDFNPSTIQGNGFSFNNINSWAFYGILIEALTVYKNQKLWQKLVRNCMLSDFSWDHAAQEYDQWYRSIRNETTSQFADYTFIEGQLPKL